MHRIELGPIWGLEIQLLITYAEDSFCIVFLFIFYIYKRKKTVINSQ